MSYLIKKWYLPYQEEEEPSHEYNIMPNDNWLENLSKVNIFVGANNSGKSRFIRHLVEIGKDRFSPADFDLDYLLLLINNIKEIIREHYKGKGISDVEEIYRDIYVEKLTPKNYIETNAIKPINIDSLMKGINAFVKGEISLYTTEYDIRNLKILALPIIEKIKEIAASIDCIMKDAKNSYNFYKIYIPTLRGLRPFSNPGDWYRERTQKDYFTGNPLKEKEIFTGLDMYKKVDDLYKGNIQERSLLEKYEKFISNHFFESKEFKLHPQRESDVLFVKLGSEDEFPIHKLGDGIQHLIIITFPLFVNKDKDVLVFIEEPELYLHPGLQRKLLELLTNNELGSTQSFLTTHSNHFLDMSMDYSEVSIYKSYKKTDVDNPKTEFFVESTRINDRNIMELLGVKNSSVLLTNCTIWVEGITDRLYIRKYLEIYMANKFRNEGGKIFEEDKHYSFVEYSGNNITHWSFLEAGEDSIEVKTLCGTLFLIADRDDGKMERHGKLKKALNDRYWPLKCKEIENLLSPNVLIATIRGYPNANPKKTMEFSQEDYNDRYIGEFIDNELLLRKSGKKFAAKSGTLRNKLDFAKKAINHINSVNYMSLEARKLAEKIYNFIKEHNQ